jgi:hypothetical protein
MPEKGQMVGLQPIPEALALREGQNQILEDSDELAHGTKATLEFKIPGVDGQAFFFGFMNEHKEAADPVVSVRILQITLYKPRERGGLGQAVKLITQGRPYSDTIMGNGPNTFLLLALEAIDPKSLLSIEVENVDAAKDLDDYSITIVGTLEDIREAREE